MMISRLKKLGKKVDWKALAFCVFAASTFWFFNAMNQDYTVNIYYPLKFEYDQKEIIAVQTLPNKIKVNVRGYGWNLLRKFIGVKVKPIIYSPDHLPYRKYVAASELSALLTKQLEDVEFNYMIMDTVFFEFDYLKEKKVKVVVDSSLIAMSPSYRIISPIILSPDSILFKGPESYLHQVPDSIRLDIFHTDIKENFQKAIKVPEKGFSKVDMLNKEVIVRFAVAKFEKQSTLAVAQLLNFPPDSSMVKLDKNIILTYYIKEEDKNKVAPKDFLVYLDFKDLDKSDSTIGPKLIKKPSFIKDYYFTPYAIKINQVR